MVICLEQGADLHLAQLMPLPFTVSCFSKIQIGSTFLVLAHLGSPGKRAVKRMCVCVQMVYTYITAALFILCQNTSNFFIHNTLTLTTYHSLLAATQNKPLLLYITLHYTQEWPGCRLYQRPITNGQLQPLHLSWADTCTIILTWVRSGTIGDHYLN